MADTDDDFLKNMFSDGSDSLSDSDNASDSDNVYKPNNEVGLSDDDLEKLFSENDTSLDLDDTDINLSDLQQDDVNSSLIGSQEDEAKLDLEDLNEDVNLDNLLLNEGSDSISENMNLSEDGDSVSGDMDLNIDSLFKESSNDSQADNISEDLMAASDISSNESIDDSNNLEIDNTLKPNSAATAIMNDSSGLEDLNIDEMFANMPNINSANVDVQDTDDDIFSLDSIIGQLQDDTSSGEEEIDSITDALMSDIPEKTVENTDSAEDKPKKKAGFFKRIFGNVPEEISDEELAKRKQKVYDDADAKEKAEIEKAEKAAEAKAKKEADKKAAEEEKKAKKAEAEKQKAEKKKAAAEKKAAKKDAKLKKQLEIQEQIQEIENNEGKINKVGSAIIFVLFTALAIFLVVGTNMYVYNLNIKTAKEEFAVQKYNEAYDAIKGVNVKEKDLELYYKIMNVMYVNKQLNSYNNYTSLNMSVEALDSLLKGLKRYEQYYTVAMVYGIVDDFNRVRDRILYELDKVYGISEAEAESIIGSEDQLTYSMKVYEYATVAEDK